MKYISRTALHVVILSIVSISLTNICSAQVQVKLTASDGVTEDRFGWSVAVSGEKALVGASRNDDNGVDSGSAYIFERQNGTWVEVAKFTSEDNTGGDAFGIRSALSGNRALIGATADDDAGGSSGSAYIFELIDGAWTQTAKLTASDAEAADVFGISVSLSGDRALVGAYFEDENGDNAGAAYIFELQNGAWIQTAKLLADDGVAGDLFGASVSISGDRAVVGALNHINDTANSGSVYVFELQDGGWSQVAELIPNDVGPYAKFGNVSLYGNKILVGAGGELPETNTGAAYLFEKIDGSWSQTSKLTASDGNLSDFFGGAVSILDNKALVGARGQEEQGFFSGAAYLFELQDGQWIETAKLTASNGDSEDNFGISLGLSENYAIVGAYNDDDKGENAGAAYIFDDGPIDTTTTITERIEDLSSQVEDLVNSDVLSEVLGTRVSHWLHRALGTYEAGNTEAAVQHLGTFISSVERLVSSRKLSGEEGQNLIDQASEIVMLIEEERVFPLLGSTSGMLGAFSTDQESVTKQLPDHFALQQNYPNPFNPTTHIGFSLSETAPVRLTVYDMLGREVDRLVEGVLDAGFHEVSFEGEHLPSGFYIYRLETPKGDYSRTMSLLN